MNSESITTTKTPPDNNYVSSTTKPPPAPALTKPQKGRFKKLKKRAFSSREYFTPGNTTSAPYQGITSFDEYKELCHYIELTNRERYPGPSVLFTRTPEDGEEDQRYCEGVDHRDLIAHLLFYSKDHNMDGNGGDTKQEKKSKKRKQSTNDNSDSSSPLSNKKKWINDRISASIPNWSVVHNPACLTNLAVIQFSLEHSSSSKKEEEEKEEKSIVKNVPTLCTLLQSNPSSLPSSSSQPKQKETKQTSARTMPTSSKNNHNRSAIQLQTRLFQGSYPKSISDILLYLDPPSPSLPSQPSSKKCKVDEKTAAVTNETTYEKIAELLLTKKQLITENYPIPLLEKDDTEKRIKMEECIKQHSLQIEEFCKKNKTQSMEREETVLQQLPLISLNQSKEIVKTIGIGVTFGSDDGQETHNQSNSEKEEKEEEDNRGKYVQTFLSHKSSSSSLSSLCESSTSNIYALDCEMVKTTVGIELARVTLLRYNGDDVDDVDNHHHHEEKKNKEGYDVVMDVLVQPQNKVVDYLTEYSGMTPKLLSSITTQLSQIQCVLLSIIHKEDIIIGHSLENDLKALRIVHNCVVDTSILFRGRNGRKFSLRHLSSALLKRQIQSNRSTTYSNEGQQQGHCSEEDAAAALTLVLRRCRQGGSFCLKEQLSRINLLNLICTARRKYVDSSSLFPIITGGEDSNKPLVCIGPNEWLQKYITNSHNSAHALTCESVKDDVMVKGVLSWLKNKKQGGGRRASLLWANLIVGIEGGGKNKNSDEKGAKGYSRIDRIVSDLISQIPTSTVILFVFQHDYQKAVALTQRRKACKDPRSTLGWTEHQEKHWNDVVDKCRSCEAFWVGMSS